MRLHPIASDVKCPKCSCGPLEYVSVYVNIGDKYQCASCKSTVIHRRRKTTMGCGLMPLLGFGTFGTWKEDSCQSAPAGVGASKQEPQTKPRIRFLPLEMLRNLQQVHEKIGQSGSTAGAQTPLRRVLRELDRLLHARPNPDKDATQTDPVSDPERECASHIFLLCRSAASALGSSPPDISTARQALNQAIQHLNGDRTPKTENVAAPGASWIGPGTEPAFEFKTKLEMRAYIRGKLDQKLKTGEA
jgi:hypothetical protein